MSFFSDAVLDPRTHYFNVRGVLGEEFLRSGRFLRAIQGDIPLLIGFNDPDGNHFKGALLYVNQRTGEYAAVAEIVDHA